MRGQTGEFTIEPGQTRPLGETGYTVEASEFLPAFPLFGSGEPTDTLELLVHPPDDAPFPQTFRRYILDGKPTQTDFIPSVAGAGPKGKRQDQPVDGDLVLNLTHSDGLNLLPRGGETERHTFLTKPGDAGVWQVVASNAAPAVLHYAADGKLALRIDGQIGDPERGPVTPKSVDLDVERVAHVARLEWVQEVPPALRDRKKAEGGSMQVVTVRARRGDWQQIVQVPYSPWPDQAPWSYGVLNVPGTDKPVQLQLGNTRRQMPAKRDARPLRAGSLRRRLHERLGDARLQEPPDAQEPRQRRDERGGGAPEQPRVPRLPAAHAARAALEPVLAVLPEPVGPRGPEVHGPGASATARPSRR